MLLPILEAGDILNQYIQGSGVALDFARELLYQRMMHAVSSMFINEVL